MSEHRGLSSVGPATEWPNHAQIAVSIVVNFEEGAEVDGRTATAAFPRETMSEAFYPTKEGQRELIQESVYEYGARSGIWRVLQVLDEYAVTATVFACGQAVERHSNIATTLASRNYEFAGHGYRWVRHLDMVEDAERQAIQDTVAAIEATVGQRIVGWYTRPPSSPNTRRLLVEQGFLYDSDSLADDLPYFVPLGGKAHLVIPYSLDVNDIRFWKGSMFTANDWFEYARDSFDALYHEAEISGPKMMSVGLHPRIIGRPGRILALSRFLHHLRGFDKVWVTTRREIAEFWLRNYGG